MGSLRLLSSSATYRNEAKFLLGKRKVGEANLAKWPTNVLCFFVEKPLLILIRKNLIIIEFLSATLRLYMKLSSKDPNQKTNSHRLVSQTWSASAHDVMLVGPFPDSTQWGRLYSRAVRKNSFSLDIIFGQ